MTTDTLTLWNLLRRTLYRADKARAADFAAQTRKAWFGPEGLGGVRRVCAEWADRYRAEGRRDLADAADYVAAS